MTAPRFNFHPGPGQILGENLRSLYPGRPIPVIRTN